MLALPPPKREQRQPKSERRVPAPESGSRSPLHPALNKTTTTTEPFKPPARPRWPAAGPAAWLPSAFFDLERCCAPDQRGDEPLSHRRMVLRRGRTFGRYQGHCENV